MKHSTTQMFRRALCGLVLLAAITEKVQAINSYYWVSRDWTSGAVYGAYWSYGNSWSASSGGSGLGGSGLTVGGVQSYLNFDGSAAAPANGLYNNTNDFNNAGGFQIYFKSTVPAAYNLYGNPITFYDNSTIDPNIQNEGTTYTPTINFAITNGNYNGTYRILNINLNTSPAQGPITFNGPIYGSAVDANTRVINIGGGNITFNNTIANGAGGGTLALTLLGAGTVKLAATNTFTGDLSINAGTVLLATNSAVSASGAIRLGDITGSTGANLNLNGGNTVSALVNVRATTGTKIFANTAGTAGAATFAGNLYLDGDATLFANTGGGNVLSGATLDLKNQTLTVNGTGTNLISGSLQQSTGSGKLVVSATNATTLAGNNTYTGGTTLNSGALLNLNSATALGTGTLTFNGTATNDNTSGAAITLANNNPLTLSGGSLIFSGTADLNFGTGVVTISGANRTMTVNAGNLTFGGGVTDAGGARQLTKAGAGTLILNGAAGTWTGGFTASAGTVNLGNNTALGTGLFTLGGVTLVASGGARTIANPVLWTVAATIGGTNSLTFSGGFTNSAASHQLTISNTNTVTLAGPVYLADDNVNARTVTITNSGPVVISGPIANNNLGDTIASTLQVNGTNTTTLSGTNTFTGQLTVQSGGVVSVASLSNALGTVSTIQLGGGSANGTLVYTGPGETSTRTILFAASSAGSGQVIDQSGSGLLNFTNAFNSSGSVNFTLTLQGSTSGSGQISSVLSNNAAGTTRSLVKTGTGTWTLAGVNTYTGLTTVSNGTLTIGGAGQLGGGSYAQNILNFGAFNYASTAAQTLSGVISGTGSLTNSSGALTLSGINTYSGATTISGGELIGVTGGSCANSAVSVSAGGTNGVQVTSPAGQWICAGLAYGSGTSYADFNFANNASPGGAAPLLVNGSLAFNGTLNVIVRGNLAVGTYPLIKYTGSLSGTPPVTAFSLPAGVTGNIVNNTANKSIDLNVTGNTSEVLWAVGNGNWDTATANWKNTGGSSTNYVDGDFVVFDDTVIGVSPVTNTLASLFTPAGIVANLTNKNYTISGPSNFLGNATLTKNGAGTLTINTTNSSYTGSVVINGGTLAVGNGNNPIGTGTITMNNASTFINGAAGTSFTANPILVLAGAAANINAGGQLGSGLSGNVASGDATSSLTINNTTSFNATTRQFDGFLGTINVSATLRFSGTSGTDGSTNATFNVTGTLQSRNAGQTWTLGALSGSGNVGPNQSASGSGVTTYQVGTNNASTTFSGKIFDFGSSPGATNTALTKFGTGTMTVSGNSPHSGATTVNVGALIGVTGGSFSNSAVIVASGATNGVNITTPGGIWTCTNLTYNAGTCVATFAFGANTPSTTVAPLSVLNNLALNGTLNILISGSVTAFANGAYPLIKYAGTITGAPAANPLALPLGVFGVITNDTANKQISLLVTNVVTPTLVWQAGTGNWDFTSLAWTNGLAGTLTNWSDINYFAQFDDTASGSGPFTVTLTTNVNPLAVVFTNSTKNYTLTGSGNINGSGTLTKANAGTLTLLTTNAFTGGTTVSGGTLQGNSSTLLGNIANSAALVFDQTFTGSNNAVISGTGTVTKQNTGTVALGGNNTFTGNANVNQGTLAISAGANLGGARASATTNAITINGGTLQATNGAATITLPTNAGITVGAGGATIDVASGITLDYPAQAINGTGALVKNGAGTFQIDEGTASSTYSSLTLNAGAIAFNKSSGGLGAGALVINGGLIRTTSTSSRTPNNSSILVNADFTLGAPGTAAISFAGGGAWTLANGNRTITVDTIAATITGAIGDGGNNYQLIKAGSGTLVLGNASTFGGGISQTAGILNLGVTGSAGTGSTVSWSGGTVQVGGGVVITNKFDNSTGSTSDLMMDCPTGTGVWAGPVSSSGSGGFRPGTTGGTLVFTGNGSLGNRFLGVVYGTVIFATNASFSSSAAGNSFGRDSANLGRVCNVTFMNNAAGSFTGAVSLGGGKGGGNVTLTIQDSASLSSAATYFDLNAINTTTAAATVNLNGGTLTVGNFIKTYTGGGQTATFSFNGGTLKAGQTSTSFLPALTGLTAIVSTNGGTLNDNGFNITVAQPLTHDATLGATADGGLVKSGAGVTTLSGANTYTGPTVVNAGTLLLTGALGTNALTVNSVLNGTGTVNGPATVNFGGTLQAGLGGGDFSALAISNSLMLAGNAVFNLDRTNSSVPTANKISGLTSVTYGGTLTVTNLGPALSAGDTFTLFQSAAYAGGFTNLVLPSLTAGLGWNTNNLAVNGTLSVVSLLGVAVAPATTNVTYGTSVTLTANVTGSGPLTYQWYDNTAAAISGQTNSTLALIAPAVAASGSYKVVVANLSGSATNSATVTVSTAPLSVTANNDTKTYGQTKIYGSGSTNFTSLGLQNGESIGSATVTSSGGTNANDAVGGYTLAISAATGGTFNPANYSLTYSNGTLTVNALAAVLAGTRVYDGTPTAAAGILSVANKVGSDDVNTASGSATLAGAGAGVQPIVSFGSIALGGTTAGNYTFAGASGSVTITAAGTTTAIASSSNPSGYLDALVFTANVAPTNASGSVTFTANGTPFSTNTLVAGTVSSVSIGSLARGTNTISAVYSGDTNYAASSISLSQIVTNHPPVATNVSFTVASGVVSLRVAVSNLLANVSDSDGDTITLVSVDNSTNLITPTIGGGLVEYYNTNGVNDQFSYTVTDGFGGTNSAYVSIVVSNALVGQVTGSFTSFTGGVANLTFHGIPDLSYVAERSTNLLDWVDVVTNTAATNGVISVQDYFYDLGGTPPSSAYYRLKWQP